jgi:transcriptional regulator of acetoin/glycerol metabolism
MEMLSGNAAAQSEIVASWKRCVSLHNLSPERDVHTEIMTQFELRQAFDPLERYIQIAETDLQALARFVAPMGFFVSVSDGKGTALLHRGALPKSGSVMRKIRDGMMWREDLQGTNAIGTGLFVRHPIAIHVGEHFFASNYLLTCLVAPLYDPFGRSLGAVNIASPNTGFDRTLTSVLLGTLVTTAQHIESRLLRFSYPNTLIVSLPDSAAIDGSIPLVAVDPDFNVVGATHAVRCSYGVTNQALETGISVGRFFPDVGVEGSSLAQAEKVALERALNVADQCVSLAATRLGISRATMHRKMRAHCLLRKKNLKRRDT